MAPLSRFGFLATLSVLAAFAATGTAFSAQSLPASAVLLVRYDTNKDGVITRSELDAALKAEFAAADTNHDGRLTGNEITAENARRLKQDGAQAAPVRDWNGDGAVDLTEFSNAAHSYFTSLDTSGSGVVRVSDLRDASLAPANKLPSLSSPIADPDYNPGTAGPMAGTGY